MAKKSINRRETLVSTVQGTGKQTEQTLTVDDSALPSPQELEHYQRIDPRIVEMFIDVTKKEQENRHKDMARRLDIIEQQQKDDREVNRRGMLYAFLSLALFISLTAFALYFDHPWFAAISCFSSFFAIVGMFLGSDGFKGKEENSDGEENYPQKLRR